MSAHKNPHFSDKEHLASAPVARRGQRLRVRAPGDGAAALGIYAINASVPSQPPENPHQTRLSVVTEDGEVLTVTKGKDCSLQAVADPRQARWERYALKSVVNRLLPTSRTSKCMRWRLPNRDTVDVMRGKANGKAYYQGLQVCASVWACPVCAAKITERRRIELQGAMEEAKRQDLQPYLLTLTVPHGIADPLEETLTKLRKAWRYMQSDRAGKAFWRRAGVEGHIRALEVTDGDNGWHPHLHILLFVGTPEPMFKAQQEASSLWQHCATKAGLPTPHPDYGCRLDDGTKAAKYVSKWGLESELTKGHVKKSSKGNSIWDLLRGIREGHADKKRYAARFIEFAEAFKGQRQLVWSKGLKTRLLVTEMDDEELANAPEDLASLCLAELSDDQWDRVRFAKMEAALLDLAETAAEAIPDFLAALPPPRTESRPPWNTADTDSPCRGYAAKGS